MTKTNKTSCPLLGGCALLVIFGVLCLTVFALLSLHTVLAEQRLSRTAAEQAEAWYEADLRAQEIFARLRGGEIPPEVEKTGEEYHYCVSISPHQTLEVTLTNTNGSWEILSWRTVAHPEDGDISLPVWQEAN